MADRAGAVSFCPVICDEFGTSLVQVSPQLLSSLLVQFQSGHADQQSIKASLREMLGSASPWLPCDGDRLLLAGAFWVHDPQILQDLHQRKNIIISAFIHDIIIWNNEEYFNFGDRSVFISALIEMFYLCSSFVTSSRHVAKELQAFASAYRLTCPRTTVLGMASDAIGQSRVDQASAAVGDLKGRRFVLCVGTIEARKNHSYLLDIWDRLVADLGASAPVLVFAGKVGWNVDQVLDRMAALDWRPDHFMHLADVGDERLGWLYRNCLFTIYPSLMEGWGLPVSESLAHGKPCIAADTSSLPEAGGEFALYCNPEDVGSGLQLVHELLTDSGRLEALTRRIATDYRETDWATFTARLVASLAQVAFEPVRWNRLEGGIYYRFGRAAPPVHTPTGKGLASMAALSEGWRGVEPDAVIARAPGATLAMQTEYAVGQRIDMLLALSASDALSAAITSGGGREVRVAVTGTAGLFALNSAVGAGGVIELCLDWAEVSGNSVAMKLHGLAMAEPGHSVARLTDLVAEPDTGANSGDWQDEFVELVVDQAGSRGIFGSVYGKIQILRARRAARKRDWRRAKQLYAQALAVRSWDASAWKQFGHASRESGSLYIAIYAYRVAFEMEGGADSRYHFNLLNSILRDVERQRRDGDAR